MVNPNLKIQEFTLVRLTKNHNILPFDCGDNDLNEFLLFSSKLFQQDLLAVTYLLEDIEANKTVAFISVLNDKISAQYFESNNKFKNRIQKIFPEPKRFRDYPAIKIGRLGVSKEYERKHIGTDLINLIKYLFISENRTGCNYITVDAYRDSLAFYEKSEFVYFSDKDINDDTRQMYYDLHIALSQFPDEELEQMKKQILPSLALPNS